MCDAGRDDDSANIVVWDASEWFASLGHPAAELGITAETTDTQLDEITTRELDNADDVDEIEGIDGYLRDLRDELLDAGAAG